MMYNLIIGNISEYLHPEAHNPSASTVYLKKRKALSSASVPFSSYLDNNMSRLLKFALAYLGKKTFTYIFSFHFFCICDNAPYKIRSENSPTA